MQVEGLDRPNADVAIGLPTPATVHRLSDVPYPQETMCQLQD